MALVIDTSDRNYIYGIIGSPNILITDTGVLTDEILDDQVILPSLREYFRWFPIEEIQQVSLSSSESGVTVDFPDDTADTYVYGVKDVRLAQLQDTTSVASTSQITNPIVQFRNIGISSGGGRYGSPYDYGFNSIRGSEQFGADAMTNLNQVFYNKVDELNKTLTLFSRNIGTAQVTWARWSDNFNNVRYTSKRELLDLCRGEMLLYWANNLKWLNPEFPTQFNVDDMVSDGQELIDKTIEKWQGKTKSVIMRN